MMSSDTISTKDSNYIIVVVFGRVTAAVMRRLFAVFAVAVTLMMAGAGSTVAKAISVRRGAVVLAKLVAIVR